MKRPTTDELAANKEKVEKLVGKFPDPRRSFVEEMLAGPVGDSFFTSPASSREEYHDAYAGGLCKHSLDVAANAIRLAKDLCPGRYPDATLVFVGLFHDLGKAGDGEHEFYVPNENEWGRKRGYLYEINKDCVWMPHAERGLYVLQKHGIELSSDEYLAIRVSDGQYVRENEPYRMHESELALIVHWADRWAVEQEKR
jgi:hypothetical protein